MSSNISPPGRDRACDRCLARSWLIDRLGGHLDKAGPKAVDVLALPDSELIAALAGKRRAEVQRELSRLDLPHLRERAESAGLELICRCDPAYPARLLSLERGPTLIVWHMPWAMQPGSVNCVGRRSQPRASAGCQPVS